MKFVRDLAEYFGYIQELSDFLMKIFPPTECVEYMEASDRPRPVVIRANTLKTTRKALMDLLTKRGAIVEAVDWSKVAIKVTESTVPIGATPEYLAGYYMLQSAASMNPGQRCFHIGIHSCKYMQAKFYCLWYGSDGSGPAARGARTRLVGGARRQDLLHRTAHEKQRVRHR